MRPTHITGSHYIMRHPDGRWTVVPYHAGRDIKRGVLRAPFGKRD
ncbi:MAG: type II toxin-antitoxin system HicA family toxin [Gammaproteobacteria bacterium]